MKTINIVPIFNQTIPGIWADFARIQSTRLSEYNGVESLDREHLMNVYSRNWSLHTHNFAFGAYCGDDMVGFLNGYVEKRIATIDGLYVLPKYRRRGIGRRLLHQAEFAVHTHANKIDLVALTRAVPYYIQRGYSVQAYESENHFVKTLGKREVAGVTPLFFSTPRITNALKKIDAEYNFARVNKLHLPTFVYGDIQGNIHGYVELNGVHVGYGMPREFVEPKLRRVFDEYLENIRGR